MYTYNDAARLSYEAQELINEQGVGVIGDSTEVYPALVDAGYLMGLAHAGCPIEDNGFQMACHALNGFINKYTEV